MKIQQVKIKNFLSFGEDAVEVNLSDFNIIVGPNASGKTNLLRALAYLGDCLGDNRSRSDSEYFHPDDAHQGFEIEASISLTEEEAKAIANYLVCTPVGESIPVRDGENQYAHQRLAFGITTKLRDPLIEVFRNVSLIIRKRSTEGDLEKLLKITVLNNVFYIDTNGQMRKRIDRDETSGSESFGRLLIDNAQTLYPEVKEYLSTGKVWQGEAILTESDARTKVLEAIIRNIGEKHLSVQIPNYIQLSVSGYAECEGV